MPYLKTGWRQNTGWPPKSFVQTIATHIKSLAPSQLIAVCFIIVLSWVQCRVSQLNLYFYVTVTRG